MAKQVKTEAAMESVPYFRFTVAEWVNGKISRRPLVERGLLIEFICNALSKGGWMPWSRLDQDDFAYSVNLSVDELDEIVTGLIERDIVVVRDEKLSIKFVLDVCGQVSDIREKRSAAGAKGGNKRKSPTHSKGSKADEYLDPRWQRLRLEAMQRDDWRCIHCGDDSSTLHVHHKQYGNKIWDVDLDDLQTLCESCHSLLGPHPKGGVWWNGDGGITFIHCPKCGGSDLKDKGSFDKCLDCGNRLGYPF